MKNFEFPAENGKSPVKITILDGGRVAIQASPDTEPSIVKVENSVAGRFLILNWYKSDGKLTG